VILSIVVDSNLDNIENVAKEAVSAGGQRLMQFFRTKPRVWAKSPFEMVSEADIASETAIISMILDSYPQHTILSEERGRVKGEQDNRWIIDPLDGTFKFIMGVPYFSISLAYQRYDKIELSVVYNPFMEDFYIAKRGRGATKNGIPLRIPKDLKLHSNYVCCDWGGSLEMQSEGLSYLSKLLPPSTRGNSVHFSPALDLCCLAEGSIVAVISNGTTIEDHSGAALIVTEAGGEVRDFTSQDAGWCPETKGIIAASNTEILQEVLSMIFMDDRNERTELR